MDLFLEDVVIVDARGPRGPVDVRISGDRIVAIGDLARDPAVPSRSGGFVTPGLIDTHVHITLAPGAAWRDPDTAASEGERRAFHLRSYVACGVTTLLDPASVVEEAREVAALASQGPAPAVRFLGPTVSPVGGYVAVVIPSFPSLSSAADVPAFLDGFTDPTPVGVKITMEDGTLYPIWPLHDEAVRTALIAETDRRGLPRYVHAMREDMILEGLRLKPHAFVHAPQAPLSDEALAALVSSGAYVAPTLAIVGTARYPFRPEALDDPWVAARVPPDELATARDPEIQDQFVRAMLDTLAPDVPKWLQGPVVWIAARESAIESRLSDALAATRQLHEAGVPLVLGSDAGNWPILPSLFHGPSTHLELALMAEAGVPPLAILTAATETPARMLGLDDVGTIEVGKRADLIWTEHDPLQDITVLRSPGWVILGGQARTPEAWLAGPGAP